MGNMGSGMGFPPMMATFRVVFVLVVLATADGAMAAGITETVIITERSGTKVSTSQRISTSTETYTPGFFPTGNPEESSTGGATIVISSPTTFPITLRIPKDDAVVHNVKRRGGEDGGDDAHSAAVNDIEEIRSTVTVTVTRTVPAGTVTSTYSASTATTTIFPLCSTGFSSHGYAGTGNNIYIVAINHPHPTKTCCEKCQRTRDCVANVFYDGVCQMLVNARRVENEAAIEWCPNGMEEGFVWGRNGGRIYRGLCGGWYGYGLGRGL